MYCSKPCHVFRHLFRIQSFQILTEYYLCFRLMIRLSLSLQLHKRSVRQFSDEGEGGWISAAISQQAKSCILLSAAPQLKHWLLHTARIYTISIVIVSSYFGQSLFCFQFRLLFKPLFALNPLNCMQQKLRQKVGTLDSKLRILRNLGNFFSLDRSLKDECWCLCHGRA